MLWEVRFRYIPPYDAHTPPLHIPVESTLVEAESADAAWGQFLSLLFPIEHREWYRKEEVVEG